MTMAEKGCFELRNIGMWNRGTPDLDLDLDLELYNHSFLKC